MTVDIGKQIMEENMDIIPQNPLPKRLKGMIRLNHTQYSK